MAAVACMSRRGRALSLCAGLKSTSRMATAMPASPLRTHSVCPVSMPFTFVHCSAAVPALLGVFMHHVGVFGVCADVSCLHVRVDGGAG